MRHQHTTKGIYINYILLSNAYTSHKCCLFRKTLESLIEPLQLSAKGPCFQVSALKPEILNRYKTSRIDAPSDESTMKHLKELKPVGPLAFYHGNRKERQKGH
jgi:hypothetical protein